MGAISASASIEEALDEGYSPVLATTAGSIKGLAEVFTEKLGTIGIFKRLEKEFAKSLGNVTTKTFMKELGKQAALAFGTEALEEGVNSIVSDLTELLF